jgi:hypothetical protein
MKNVVYESIPIEVVQRVLSYKTRVRKMAAAPKLLDQNPRAASKPDITGKRKNTRFFYLVLDYPVRIYFGLNGKG